MTRFFFLHIHKTAGTSLWTRLQHQFSADELYPGPLDDLVPDRTLVPEYMLQRVTQRRASPKVITGHFPLCTTQLLEGDFTSFTVLRHPVARTISVLQHYRDNTPENRDTPLEVLYDDPVRQLLVRNHMIKMLAMTANEMTNGAMSDITVDRERLERAKEQLASIAVVGVQPRFEAFCDELSSRFEWNLGPPVMRNRSSPVEVDDALLGRIADENALDIELYEHAETIAI